MAELPLSPDDVAEIVSILDGSDYAMLDVKTSRFRLRVARDGDGHTQEWTFDESDALRVATELGVSAEAVEDGKVVRAQLPGTFYRAPAPGAAPFVTVGDPVSPDTVVGIIETMKLMNPVHAGVDGIIDAVLVDNGAMVGKGAALLRLA